MYREIEEAVAFVAAYFYYKLPRNQVDQFAVTLANSLLNCCRKIIDEDVKRMAQLGGVQNDRNPEALTRELVLDINADGKLAVVIVEAASIFQMTLKSIGALLPNAVQLRISEGIVCYSFRSNLICLYRSDGNMFHLHRRAYHTHLRPPLTVLMDNSGRKVFTLIAKDMFPHRRQCHKKKCTTMNSMKLRKVLKSAYFRRNNQQLPGPTRSAKLSGNGFMHPSLPPGYSRRWKGAQKAQESLQKSKEEQRTHIFGSKNGQNLNLTPTKNSNSPENLRSGDCFLRNPSRDTERSTAVVTDEMLHTFGVLASDYSVSVVF